MTEKKATKKDLKLFAGIIAELGDTVSQRQADVLNGVYRDQKPRGVIARELGITLEVVAREESAGMKSLVNLLAPGCLEGYSALSEAEDNEANDGDQRQA